MSDNTAIVLQILHSYANKENLNIELTEEQIKDLFLVMKSHDLVHIPGIVISNSFENPKYEVFKRAQLMAALRYEQQNYERIRITELFEKNGIKHIHLKGSVIAQYYYEPWHRTSCDIDVLIPHDNLNKASKLLTEQLGYVQKSNMTNHDISLFRGTNIHVELHYDLCKTGISLSDAWDNASAVSGMKYSYSFTPEILMLYQYAHMANHFKTGGCGLKSVLDLFFLKANLKYDKKLLDDLLIKGGIKKFADEMLRITNVWFSDAPSSETTDLLTNYIMISGAYGNIKHTIAVYLHDSKGNSERADRFKYIFSRLFLSYDHLKYIYPVLLKHQSLTPIYQVKRWISFMSPKRFRRVRNEIETYFKMDKEDPKRIIDMLHELELLKD